MTLARRAAAEALGTFLLVAVGPGAIMVAERSQAFGHAGIAAAFGLVVAVLVAALGPVSGAHINPAVSVGLWSIGRMPGRELAPYIGAQLLGAVVAAAALGWLLGPIADFGVTTPKVPVAQAFVIEAGYTMVLGLVIAGVALDPRAPRALAPVILGATVALGALVTGPLTGGSFNPARTFGPAVVAGVWTTHWLYWAAPMVGLAAGLRIHGLLVVEPAGGPM